MATESKATTAKKTTTTAKKTTTTTRKTTPKPAVDPAVEALKQQNELLMQQLAELKAQMEAQAQAPQVVRIATDDEKVVFMWNAEVADENVVSFGPNGIYGRITGKYGTFFVPKSELSRVLDNETTYYLKVRWLTVLSGLTDEERKMLDVDYKPGELLSKEAYKYMVEIGDKMVDLYPALHKGHKQAVAQRYYEQWQMRNPHVKRETVLKLLKVSAGEAKEAFQKIISEMNEAELSM